MADTKHIARQRIMSYILQFCITHVWPGSQHSPSLHGFVSSGYDSTGEVQIGDLVILSSAPATKWTIGWVRDIELKASRYDTRYLIESLEDGELCWWCNAGLSFLQRDELVKHPEWRWTDRQFAFNRRWLRQGDGYIMPMYAEFSEDGHVTLSIRTKWELIEEDIRPKITLLNWKKVTVAKLRETYMALVVEQKRLKDERKAA